MADSIRLNFGLACGDIFNFWSDSKRGSIAGRWRDNALPQILSGGGQADIFLGASDFIFFMADEAHGFGGGTGWKDAISQLATMTPGAFTDALTAATDAIATFAALFVLATDSLNFWAEPNQVAYDLGGATSTPVSPGPIIDTFQSERTEIVAIRQF